MVVCSSYETVNDTFDWDRFEKPIMGALLELRSLLGDGLFTARGDEKASLVEDSLRELSQSRWIHGRMCTDLLML